MKFIRNSYDLFNDWSARSTNRRIFSAMLTVGVFSIFVNLGNFGKEILVAAKLGTGDDLDAFLIALLLPTFVVGLVGNAFNAAFIPTFINVRERDGHDAAQKLFSSAVVFSAVLLGICTLLLVLLGPLVLPMLGSGFNVEKIALTQQLFYLLLPVLVLSAIFSIWSAVLQAGERFALAALAPVLCPLTVIVCLLWGFHFGGVKVLAVATTLGFILALLPLGWSLKKKGFLRLPRWYGMDADLRQVIGQYVPMVAAVFMMSSTTLVDQAMAAMLDSGSVATLNYANKLVGLILTLGGTALGTAILPHFSRLAANCEWAEIQHVRSTYYRLILIVSVIVTMFMIYFSEPLIKLFFERGVFTAADTILVANVQTMYCLQIPVYILVIMNVRIISALNMNKLLMYISFLNLMVNIIFNYIFMKYFGLPGIALSTACVYLLGFTISHLIVKKEINFRLANENF